MCRLLFPLAFVVALVVGSGAMADELTRPNADIRALEPGVDVKPGQVRAQQPPSMAEHQSMSEYESAVKGASDKSL